MSKGKYEHKKENAQKRAEQGNPNVSILDESEKGTNTIKAQKRQEETKDKKWYPMSLKERFKTAFNAVKSTLNDSNRLIAIFTFALVAVAIYQFVVIHGQLDVMRKDLRAWITVTTKGTPNVAIGVAPSWTVSVVNTGKTPATHVVVNAFFEVVPNGDDPNFSASIMHTAEFSGVIMPNQTLDMDAVRSKPHLQEYDPIVEAEQISLSKGEAYIAVYGMVRYDDVLKQSHWMKFCFWNSAKPGNYTAMSCARYGSIDEQ